MSKVEEGRTFLGSPFEKQRKQYRLIASLQLTKEKKKTLLSSQKQTNKKNTTTLLIVRPTATDCHLHPVHIPCSQTYGGSCALWPAAPLGFGRHSSVSCSDWEGSLSEVAGGDLEGIGTAARLDSHAHEHEF